MTVTHFSDGPRTTAWLHLGSMAPVSSGIDQANERRTEECRHRLCGCSDAYGDILIDSTSNRPPRRNYLVRAQHDSCIVRVFFLVNQDGKSQTPYISIPLVPRFTQSVMRRTKG